MKSNFCKSDPNQVARWFEMRFKSIVYRCVFSPDALLVQIGYQSVRVSPHGYCGCVGLTALTALIVLQQSTYGTPFSQDRYPPNILTQKCHFLDTQIKRKLTLFETCLLLSNTFSRDLATGASRLALQRT